MATADYYVAEGMKDGGEGGDAEEGNPDAAEPNGTGVNTYTYWVTTSLTGAWLKLPDTTPVHIKAARKIKKILTGDITSKVITHPHFPRSGVSEDKKAAPTEGEGGGKKEVPDLPGTEEYLLRAQIARISADTVLCIKGFIQENEDGEVKDREAGDPPFVPPPPAELAKASSWTHERVHILRNGRTTHQPLDDAAEDEDAEKKAEFMKMKKEQMSDPMRSRVRGILDYPDLQWAVRQCGDKSVYSSEIVVDGEKQKTTTSYAVTAVRCLTWPGAVCVAKGGHFTNLYVGHGLKYGEPDFFPCAPLDIQDEPEDPGDQPEPQPIGGAPVAQEEAPAEEVGG